MPAIVDRAPADGGAADQRVRVGRDPAVPGQQDRQVLRRRPARPRRGQPVAALADGRAGTDDRPVRPLPRLRARRPSRTPRTATSAKCCACSACSTNAWQDREFIAGHFSIADMAAHPWINAYTKAPLDLDAVRQSAPLACADRRASGGAARLCVARAVRPKREMTPEMRKILFGTPFAHRMKNPDRPAASPPACSPCRSQPSPPRPRSSPTTQPPPRRRSSRSKRWPATRRCRARA